MFLYNIIFCCLFFTEPTKILIIGDSYLYTSNVDSLLSKTARFNHKNVEITSSLFPGRSIQMHLDSGLRNSKDPRTGKIYPMNPTIDYLKNSKWDYIIVQIPPVVKPNQVKDEFIVPIQRIRKWIGDETKLILLVPENMKDSYPEYVCGYNNQKSEIDCFQYNNFQEKIDTLRNILNTNLKKFDCSIIYFSSIVNYLQESGIHKLYIDSYGHPNFNLATVISSYCYYTIYDEKPTLPYEILKKIKTKQIKKNLSQFISNEHIFN